MQTLIQKLIIAMFFFTAVAQAQTQEVQPPTEMNQTILHEATKELISQLKVSKSTQVKRDLLESFYKELRVEIKTMNDQGIRSDTYWSAIELSVNIGKILDIQKCAPLKSSISNAEFNMKTNDKNSLSKASKTALKIADLVCE